MSYIASLKAIKELIAAEANIIIDYDAIYIQPDIYEFITRIINDHPSAAIRIIESPERFRDATAAKSTQSDVNFAIDFCKRNISSASSEFDPIMIDNASSTEELFQFSTLSGNVGITTWQETMRITDYGEDVMCYRVVFKWKKTS